MDNHVNAVTKSIHYHIRALRHIHFSISEDMAKMVASALVGFAWTMPSLSYMAPVSYTHLTLPTNREV